jgi:S-adenosylhomocysteine hydrolase
MTTNTVAVTHSMMQSNVVQICYFLVVVLVIGYGDVGKGSAQSFVKKA